MAGLVGEGEHTRAMLPERLALDDVQAVRFGSVDVSVNPAPIQASTTTASGAMKPPIAKTCAAIHAVDANARAPCRDDSSENGQMAG